MRRWLSSVSVLFASLLLAAPFGCPGNNVEQCEAQMRLFCELQFRCCTAEERLTTTFSTIPYVTSEGECVDIATSYCRTYGAGLDDAVAAGRLRYDAAKGQECIAALLAARDACDYAAYVEATAFPDDTPGLCTQTTEGLVAAGDACADDAECAGEGSYCDIDWDDPEINEELGTQDGECVALGGEGEDCSEVLCGEGLYCATSAEGGASTCAVLPGLGEACPDLACAGDLACSFDTATSTYRCVEPPGIGDECPAFQCAAGAFCNDVIDPAVCEAQVEPGGECDPELFDQCAGDEVCDDTTTPPVCSNGTRVDPELCNGI